MSSQPLNPWHLGGLDPYRRFTDDCNATEPVVILSSGQACVWHRLTLASKDGDWIIREDEPALAVVRRRLQQCGARYRLGAPLDVRWLAAGWSSHFEALAHDGTRLRFDFVSRPPRLQAAELANLWLTVHGAPAVVPIRELITIKRTMRLKDYAFIGSLSLRLDDPVEQVRTTLDAEHLLGLLAAQPQLAARLGELRPTCAAVPLTKEALSAAIDAEIRHARAADEARIGAYMQAIAPWSDRFRALHLEQLSVDQAHTALCAAAEGCLPTVVSWS